ncbi:hypothetical protein SAMN05446037_100690 [Anaerovirgula multivorans]|uniref:Uncharacterized protein n=1 Tax=Anaerovirgula multivorans TaxID=312168 RepID=A0A239CQJ9_9FIRM|nr:hypothetical protein [Anaerovirgula multivorans]SNS22189.1 hypothetical protein SAMN05446037_100690 [Anaerovirgula multivorans]
MIKQELISKLTQYGYEMSKLKRMPNTKLEEMLSDCINKETDTQVGEYDKGVRESDSVGEICNSAAESNEGEIQYEMIEICQFTYQPRLNEQKTFTPMNGTKRVVIDVRYGGSAQVEFNDNAGPIPLMPGESTLYDSGDPFKISSSSRPVISITYLC